MESNNPLPGKDLLRMNVESVEKHIITLVLKRTRGNQSEAAKQLGMTERRFTYRVRKYNIDPGQFRQKHD
jgi:Nif-specific regulatory protein